MWHEYLGATLLWQAEPSRATSGPHGRPMDPQRYRSYPAHRLPSSPQTGLARPQVTTTLPERPAPSFPQPAQRIYRLSAGAQVLARLTVARDAGGVGEAADERWRFVPHGTLGRQIEISSAADKRTTGPSTPATASPLMTYGTVAETGDGILALPAGETLYWVREGYSFPRVQWGWQHASGQPVVRFTLASSLTAERGEMIVLSASASDGAAPLLALLGWYLLVLRTWRTRHAVERR